MDYADTLIEVPVLGSLQSDNGQALITAAKAGLGVAMMQEWSIREELESGALVRLLPEYRASHIEFDNGIYAVFQHGRPMPSKVRVFVDYIVAYLKERLG